MEPDIEFRREPDRYRYVAVIEGEVVATSNYTSRDEHVLVQHTEIDDAHQGAGVGSSLVRFALDDIRSSGKRVVPICAFTRGWIERHPEYDDLVDHELLALYRR